MGDPGTREAFPPSALQPGNSSPHTCVSRGGGALATSPSGNSSREGREPLMGVCVLPWAWSPGRILPGLPTLGPPGRPRLLVWLSRLWYSMGDCSAGAKRGMEGGLQQRHTLSQGLCSGHPPTLQPLTPPRPTPPRPAPHHKDCQQYKFLGVLGDSEIPNLELVVEKWGRGMGRSRHWRLNSEGFGRSRG